MCSDLLVFRKAITPWYDSEVACIIGLLFMLLVLLFALVGVSVAGGESEFHGYLWLPVLLVLLSGFVFLSVTSRLIKRYVAGSQ